MISYLRLIVTWEFEYILEILITVVTTGRLLSWELRRYVLVSRRISIDITKIYIKYKINIMSPNIFVFTLELTFLFCLTYGWRNSETKAIFGENLKTIFLIIITLQFWIILVHEKSLSIQWVRKTMFWKFVENIVTIKVMVKVQYF